MSARVQELGGAASQRRFPEQNLKPQPSDGCSAALGPRELLLPTELILVRSDSRPLRGWALQRGTCRKCPAWVDARRGTPGARGRLLPLESTTWGPACHRGSGPRRTRSASPHSSGVSSKRPEGGRHQATGPSAAACEHVVTSEKRRGEQVWRRRPQGTLPVGAAWPPACGGWRVLGSLQGAGEPWLGRGSGPGLTQPGWVPSPSARPHQVQVLLRTRPSPHPPALFPLCFSPWCWLGGVRVWVGRPGGTRACDSIARLSSPLHRLSRETRGLLPFLGRPCCSACDSVYNVRKSGHP